MLEVISLVRILPHYRLAFHEAVKAKLAEKNVRYRVGYGRPTRLEAKKGDLVAPTWAEPARTTYLLGERLVWQSLPRKSSPDLIIIDQQNRLLSNYLLQVRRAVGGPRLAFFGHGRNFQARDNDSLAEVFKRYWADKVDWWFAYTERTAEIVAELGFPRSRITVFNNSIDVSSITKDLGSLSEIEREGERLKFCGSNHIGIFIGGLYDLKRIPFLIASAKLIRKSLPDFQLIIIGGGPQSDLVQATAAREPWIHALGPKFGREKALLASLANVFLMPGLVGLSILDSFAYGTPIVTTDVKFHSPEIDYLDDGINGIIVRPHDDIAAFANAAVKVLTDVPFRTMLQIGAANSLAKYSIENMSDRFVEGVLSALHANI